jgi:hypothetical protein
MKIMLTFTACWSIAYWFILSSIANKNTGIGSLLFPVGLVGLTLFVANFLRHYFARRSGATVATPPFPVRDKLADLVRALPEKSNQRALALASQIMDLKALAKNADDTVTQSETGPALDRLKWMHLKLLVAESHLMRTGEQAPPEDLQRRATELRSELTHGTMTPTARTSKAATLEMLEERLRNVATRLARTDEVRSDLDRIETQVSLSLERAALNNGVHDTPVQLDLASSIVNTSDFFGSAESAIKEIDADFDARNQLEN